MNRVSELRVAMEEARAYTLSLFEDVDDVDLRRQAHPDFSPLGWHLGHIYYHRLGSKEPLPFSTQVGAAIFASIG